uniref:IQ motif containing GTPase activating protein 3 n=1 Tax=Gallus gallus TaxID=9031 RepID=A0A8V1A7V1_CHICK
MDGAERPQWERPSAEQMDEQRRQNVAYQYLCRLEEAKRWMEACLGEELPPPTELEENLRNGVLLARLGHRFAPDAVPPARIYDPQQTRYRTSGLHFRHTDNINHWRCAMSRLGLPSIFHPETTDIYDKKNMPRAVYCLHALSLYLFKLGLAPQIQDLSGKVDFTEEEISDAGRELEKLGLQLPAFGRIGGILADELSLDEAAVHAAVLAINVAVERGDVGRTMEALLHPGAMLRGLRTALAAAYQDVLRGAQREKGGGREWVRTREGGDIYTHCLTQAEIQENISRVNVHAALEEVDDAVQRGDALLLHRALQDPALSLPHLQRDNLQLCLEQLRAQRQQKALELGYVELLDEEEVAVGIQVANERGEEERAMLRAVSAINAAIRRGIPAATLQALLEPSAQLPAAFPHAAALYQHQLALLQRQHPRGELLQEELFVAVEMLSAVALVNRAVDAGNPEELWGGLLSPALGLSGVEEENAQRYFDALLQLKEQLRKEGAEFLSWTDIQDSVNATNASVQDETDRLLAVQRINAALRHADPQRTLAALLLPAAALPDVALPNAGRYHRVLSRARAAKAQVGDDGAELWWEEIERGVRAANEETAAVRRMALGTAAINQAIREGRAAQTLRVLRNPDVALRGVVDACAALYQEELQALAATKKPRGTARGWDPPLQGGRSFYLSLQSFEGSWERPCDGELCATHLSREEIQSVITRVTAAHDRQRLWASNMAAVVGLQALLRGFLARRRFVALRRRHTAAVRIQASWRGYRQRKAYLQRLHYLRAHGDAVVKVGLLCLHPRLTPLCHRQGMRRVPSSVVKIQAFVRANKARGDYRMLVHERSPPLGAVRRFIHVLEQNQSDFVEEAEVLRLREEVAKRIRASQQLEGDLSLMDIQIGLLVRNPRHEVVSQCRKLTRKNREQLSELMCLDKQKGLKSLSKEKRQKLEAYQHLFYLLQTQPTYLARLLFQVPQNKSTAFLQPVVFTLYSYASHPREGYLLLQLFKAALQEEIRCRVERIHDVLTGNAAVIRMVVGFYRSARGRSALRHILGRPVREVLRDATLSIRTDPVDIYKAWVNQAESQSGQRSGLPYEVSPEQALCHPEVRRRLDASVRALLAVTEKFVSAITSSVDQIPYGMRYVAKTLRASLAEKFPEASEEELDKVVGNLLYYRFMNPAVVAPDGFDVVDVSAGAALRPEQRRSLGSIAKVLQHAAARKAFEGENGHLCGANRYLEETHCKFRWAPGGRAEGFQGPFALSSAPPPAPLCHSPLTRTAQLLLEHRDSIAPDPGDPLHELLEDLGELPTLQALVGTYGTLSREALGMYGGGAERALPPSVAPSTKQMLVDVIQCQPGGSLAEILRTPASELEEASHHHLMRRRALWDSQTPTKLNRHRSLVANSQLSVEEKKQRIVRNLRRLEVLGLVDAAQHYQGLINELAKDIRNQRRYRQHRREELLKLRQTLRALDAKTLFYEEQIDYYNQYIRSCLHGLAASNKANGKGKKLQPLRYTAARLLEMGVLLEIQDLPASQFRNVIFDIVPCREPGRFQVKAQFMGIDMERFQLHYQDLLQLQYEGVAVMKMFGKAKVNVNLLLFLLNKKFFKK